MASRILIISRGYGFMADALKSNLIREGFKAVHAEPVVKKIQEKKKDIDLILLIAGDYIYDVSEALVYLKDISEDEEIPICIMGYDDELAEIKRFIPEKHIRHVFRRPFDAKNISKQLKDIAMSIEEKKRGKHILLVDDDPTFLKMLQGWLSGKYRVTAVKSGMQAITYIANHKTDLILLDYDMPITQGPQIMEMIRSEFTSSEIPIIFLTGKSDRESIMNVMRLKPQGYLLKSMTRDDIVAAIGEYFNTSKWDNIY